MAVDKNRKNSSEKHVGCDLNRRDVLKSVGTGTVGLAIAGLAGTAKAQQPAKPKGAKRKGISQKKDQAKITLVQIRHSTKSPNINSDTVIARNTFWGNALPSSTSGYKSFSPWPASITCTPSPA
ncbi:MAG: twin-arginine translocation signal domain-containing protein [Planctomycetota bacterium]